MLFKKKEKVNNDDKIKINASTITTFVGTDSRFEGKLFTKSSVRIDGTFIGDIRSDGVVVLTKTGKIIGTVEAENMIIAGKITGNISIRDKVNVDSTGEIHGEVITGKFVNDEEAVFQGNCIMNRDGKKIPVTPYPPKEEKKEETEKGTKAASDKTGNNSSKTGTKASASKKKNRSTNRKTPAKKTIEAVKPDEINKSSETSEVVKNAEILDDEIEISDIDDLQAEESKTDAAKPKSLNVVVEE